MKKTRTVEIYSAGCPICGESIARVRNLACDPCEVLVLDTRQGDVATRAKKL